MNSQNSIAPDVAAWVAASDRLGSALVLDIMDKLGRRHQALKRLEPRTVRTTTVGPAKTLLWMNFAHDDPNTYELELKAVDSLKSGEIVVCATGNSDRSGIWGELLTTAAKQLGAAGIVTDGGVRDMAQIDEMGFPVFARYLCPYDSFNRQKVVAYDVRVEIDDVSIKSGDIVVADRDGVAIVPSEIATEVLASAKAKAEQEDAFRDAVKAGSSLMDAYERYHVL
ncbi:RraA family protein [Mesorhizobium sp. M7A.F.Ca.US.006.01.1.1]|uniref:RraA family protein n=1 Tax=Mesorhizobium sp. M7A.F.Ca.US.006.01.1.1 TaxID=2496707 RepID=UPI000FCC2C7E|nr:RraA family protein [Mesorhizobium sp. M7A.F.Ca.US.006.01.1.1]RUZ76007.1 RraA family protein [Mesorhizobium sp. M7A.F.Ca.US.006.01.1.1]